MLERPAMRGEAIRQLRYMLGVGGIPLTQSELAEKIGVHWGTISDWENNPDRVPLKPYRDRLERLYRKAMKTTQATVTTVA